MPACEECSQGPPGEVYFFPGHKLGRSPVDSHWLCMPCASEVMG